MRFTAPDPRGALGAAAALLIALTTTVATASSASAATVSASGSSPCIGDIRIKGSLTLAASDSGSTVTIGTGSKGFVYFQNCAGTATRYGELDMTLEFIAYGWGIDSCGVSVPKSAGCSVSTTRKTFSLSAHQDWASSYTLATGGPGWGFSDGGWGDTSRVCAVLRGAYNGNYALTIGESCVNV